MIRVVRLTLLLFLVHYIDASAQSLIPALTGACEKIHIVKNGEKPYGIAKQYNMTIENLVEVNRQFQAQQKLYEGETLCVVNQNLLPPVSFSG
jgi:hypothetical protein